MQKNESRLTVFFDGVFWIGIYERVSEGRLEACKITFGPEPRDCEVYEYLLQNWKALHFSPAVQAGKQQEGKVNPKRMQRIVKKQLEQRGAGTKSQQALNLQKEENKIMRKEKSHRQKEEEKQRQFELKKQKRKIKHRGR